MKKLFNAVLIKAKLLISNRSEAMEFIRYATIGVINTGVDYGLFLTMTTFFMVYSPVAQAVSQGVAIICSYFLNKNFTFKTEGRFKGDEFLKFLTINITLLGFNTLSMLILNTNLGVSRLISKILISCVSVPLGFIGNRLWAFKNKA